MKLSRPTFSFDIPLSLERENRLLVLTNLEFYYSTFKEKEKKNFSLFTDGYGTDSVTIGIKNL